MNILVIGNGFDLAHELPTKYTNFLEFCEKFLNVIRYMETIEVHEIYNDEKPVNKFICDLSNDYKLGRELSNLLKNNIWLEYFLEKKSSLKENWIDFEGEISDVIESIDVGMDNGLAPRKLSSQIIRLENIFFNNRFTKYVPKATAEEQEKIKKPKISYKELRDVLLADLNKLIRAFEIYLTEFIEKIDIKEKSPDIENIIVQMNQNEGENYILNFNYTHIIQKVYLSRYKDGLIKDMDYIHGEANINNAIESDNIVLGIGEYLPDDKKNRKIDFITFKKFYQRIHKQTGCMYKEWIDNIKWDFRRFVRKQEELEKRKYIYTDDPLRRFINHNVISLEDEDCPKHDIYIFGHSLAETDSDIFRDLILNDNVHTTIFYHDKDAMGQQIANLVKVIGQDELIRRTGGSTKTIEFKQQQDMISIENQ